MLGEVPGKLREGNPGGAGAPTGDDTSHVPCTLPSYSQTSREVEMTKVRPMSKKKIKEFYSESGTYSIAWSDEDNAFVATHSEFPSLSWVSINKYEAFGELVRLVHRTRRELELEGG